MAESKSEDQKPEEGAMAESKSEEDRISSLSDVLLIRILSFLPSKTSVQTSILSPRWRHIWKRVSVLDLSDDEFIKSNDNLIQFTSERLKRYVYLLNEDSCEFNDNINQFNPELFKPRLLFDISTETLEFANFIQFYCQRFKHFRRFFYFVNSLIYVIRPYNVQKMRLSCTKSLTKNKMCTASISAWIHSALGPLIKELDITLYTLYTYCFSLPDIYKCSNLVSLSFKGSLRLEQKYDTAFSLPSLKKLGLDISAIDATSLNAFLNGCPCLETLDLCWYVEYVEDYARFGVPPLCLPSSLKSLKILFKHLRLGPPTMRLLDDDTPLYFPKFGNLLHLYLNLLRFNSDSIMSLLHGCHSLEVLIIQNDKEVCNDKEEQPSLLKWNAQSSVPNCLESHLNVIQFKGYRGFTDELYFVEYILQKGCVLKSMIIVDISTDLKKKFDTLKRLSKVRRASSMCQLTFD